MAFRRDRAYEIDMCQGAILPKMLQFALPLMCSSILQLLFIIRKQNKGGFDICSSKTAD